MRVAARAMPFMNGMRLSAQWTACDAGRKRNKRKRRHARSDIRAMQMRIGSPMVNVHGRALYGDHRHAPMVAQRGSWSGAGRMRCKRRCAKTRSER